MATAVLGVNRTLTQASPLNLSTAPDSNLLGNKLRTMTDTYEAVTLATGSVILMGEKLPTGAKILEVVVFWDDLGSGTQSLTVGVFTIDTATGLVATAVDADAFITTQDTDAAAGTASMSGLVATITSGFLYEMLDGQYIGIDITGTTSGTIKLAVTYSHEG